MYNLRMTIIFVSPDPEITMILAHNFPQHICFTLSNVNTLTESLDNLSTMPDLLVMDYLTFNHDIYNVYKEMGRHGVYIPLIFYNDPTLTLPTRFLHWKNILEYEKPPTSEFKITEEYEEILLKIQELVESDELSPYIPLMQKPKPFPKDIFEKNSIKKMIKRTTEEKLNFLEKHLSGNQFFLFNIIFNSKNDYSSLYEILCEYKNKSKVMTEKSLEVVISRLKTKLKQLENSGFYIQSQNKKYKIIEE